MFKYLRVEIEKLNRSKVLLFGFLLIIFICTGVSIFEFRYIQFGISETFYIDFMLYNTTFVVIKVIVPILVLLLAASVWGGEYSDGMIKSFLLCKVGKTRMFAGKLILLILTSAASVLTAFITFTAISALKSGAGISPDSVLSMAKVYAVTIIGLLPILLMTVFASIVFGHFQKGFSLGAVLLFLSISLDSVIDNAYMTPTYFLSNSYVIYTSEAHSAYLIIPVLYAVLLTVAGITAFKIKDIWQ